MDPKFQVEAVAPTNYSASYKTMLNDLSCGIEICADLSSILSQCTRLTDGLTDRILIARPRLHCMQSGKNLRTSNRSYGSTTITWRIWMPRTRVRTWLLRTGGLTRTITIQRRTVREYFVLFPSFSVLRPFIHSLPLCFFLCTGVFPPQIQQWERCELPSGSEQSLRPTSCLWCILSWRSRSTWSRWNRSFQIVT